LFFSSIWNPTTPCNVDVAKEVKRQDVLVCANIPKHNSRIVAPVLMVPPAHVNMIACHQNPANAETSNAQRVNNSNKTASKLFLLVL
jgi:hypothetical protein